MGDLFDRDSSCAIGKFKGFNFFFVEGVVRRSRGEKLVSKLKSKLINLNQTFKIEFEANSSQDLEFDLRW